MCHGGHVRSVALKYLLHYHCEPSHDVIACGVHSNSPETREFLYEWADIIIVMTEDILPSVPEKFRFKGGDRKLFLYEVGVDRFGNAFHPELQNILINIINQHGLFKLKVKK